MLGGDGDSLMNNIRLARQVPSLNFTNQTWAEVSKMVALYEIPKNSGYFYERVADIHAVWQFS